MLVRSKGHNCRESYSKLIPGFEACFSITFKMIKLLSKIRGNLLKLDPHIFCNIFYMLVN